MAAVAAEGTMDIHTDKVDKVDQKTRCCGILPLRRCCYRASPDDHLCRVPQVTIYFWVIKCLSTALGETLADAFTNDVFGGDMHKALGLFIGLLVALLGFQFFLRRYEPGVYWGCVLLISITGTLITDDLVDGAGAEHWYLSIIFAVLLAMTFAAWYYFERTLSIHTIFNFRREAWYWLAVLWTFALGTAVGDLVSEDGEIGYWRFFLIVAAIIAADFIILKIAQVTLPPVTWRPVLAFWIAYVLTRPLGATAGDFLTANDSVQYEGYDSGNDCWNVQAYPNITIGTINGGNFTIDQLDVMADDFCDSVVSGSLPCIYGTDCPPHYTPADAACPCVSGELTCYTPLACDACVGLNQVLVTNVVFACIVVVLVVFLTITKIDEERDGNFVAVSQKQ